MSGCSVTFIGNVAERRSQCVGPYTAGYHSGGLCFFLISITILMETSESDLSFISRLLVVLGPGALYDDRRESVK